MDAQKKSDAADRPDDPSAPVGADRDVRGEDGGALARLREERDSLHERLLRTSAEFDNYRKRIERERRDLSEYAAADLMTELLPLIDDFERALAEAPSPATESYRRGIELIHRQLLDVLRKRGVTPIATAGAAFDPRLHQAVATEASDTHAEGAIIEEMRRGYLLGERLLRPAMVKVAAS